MKHEILHKHVFVEADPSNEGAYVILLQEAFNEFYSTTRKIPEIGDELTIELLGDDDTTLFEVSKIIHQHRANDIDRTLFVLTAKCVFVGDICEAKSDSICGVPFKITETFNDQ